MRFYRMGNVGIVLSFFAHSMILQPNHILAQEYNQFSDDGSSGNALSQLTSVDQLSDVSPNHWAYQALKSLAERYGCIVGYPDKTARGDRYQNRYQFAAAVNACIESLRNIFAETIDDLTRKEDIEAIKKLQEEFAAELATLRGRAETLEIRTATLEKQRFSTITKLNGQVLFAINGGGFSGDTIVNPRGIPLATEDPEITSLYRVSLDFDTSFRGTDLLKIRIDTGSNGIRDNAAGVLEATFGSVLDYSAKPPSNGNFAIGRLFYTFKPFKDLVVSVGPDIRTTDYVDRNTYTFLSFRDFSTLAFVNNYILFPVNGPSAGGAIDWNPGGGVFRVRALYAAADPANPGQEGVIRGTSFFTGLLYPQVGGDRGIFGDTFQGLVELEYSPSRTFAVRLQYARGQVYDNDFDVFGANAEVRLSRQVALFGRYGYGNYRDTIFGDVNPQYWMAGMAFPDLFKPGALAGIAAGQPFTTRDIGNATQTNFEAFYNFPISDNIRITPVLQVITNSSNQESNGTIITGTLRTVFTF